ncbi:MAG: hypothetical protein IPN55_16835 [Saprospiraceae bacterium]|nr:hypothetical protein [Candidatus Brachybacter algidus]
MNLSEKKAFIIEQLDNIKDEVMMDGIIEYITQKSTHETDVLINENIISQIIEERREVLAKLAQ